MNISSKAVNPIDLAWDSYCRDMSYSEYYTLCIEHDISPLSEEEVNDYLTSETNMLGNNGLVTLRQDNGIEKTYGNNVWLDNGDVNHVCALLLWELGVSDMEYVLNSYPDANKEYALIFLDMMEEDFNAWCKRSNS